ncbi:MAG: hypothetical protein A3F14_02020 [Gammaproteobacteria bacterium RIFCSPHIGHO2_12_FULL_43_28]|nr:MAG: hypothetical protein A3F14_02020 [Gammaproteobacteria bacterium RIFCSPHIGHO2_12_FULL_43_28]
MLISEVVGSKIVLHANGRIDSRTSQNFEKQFLEAIGAGNEAVIIDFKGIEYISSAGLRSLLIIAKHMQEANRDIALCAMNENVIEVIRITGFLSLFTIYPDLNTAIKKMKK